MSCVWRSELATAYSADSSAAVGMVGANALERGMAGGLHVGRRKASSPKNNYRYFLQACVCTIRKQCTKMHQDTSSSTSKIEASILKQGGPAARSNVDQDGGGIVFQPERSHPSVFEEAPACILHS